MSLPLPPQRRITVSTPPARQAGRHGARALSTLECGHVVETTADARRRNWGTCSLIHPPGQLEAALGAVDPAYVIFWTTCPKK
ncbi:hypothetical protein [Azospirillum sp. TSO22-1]|uniref:hypothetical protein n=1 Tax=Azospirillum sp. TSO22-1 TaxID=716789 RepID=UPI0011B44C9C|nr:hypothetical protein [Azospirillum sp. TSO22-1]